MAIHALIDGDWILYAAGFAGQKTFYVSPGLLGPQEFNTLTAVREALEAEETGASREELIYSRIVLDPPAHVYHSAKKMIESQLQKIGEKFNEDTVNYTVLIDGDGNFRSRIATLRPYKGHRAPDAKPKMFNEIRSYLLDAWDAEVVHDHETDDEMTIRQTQYAKQGVRSVIVGVDKDYMQCPGWWLNPNKGFKHIVPQQGQYYLYVQCLTGDTADNIPGCYKCGPKKAQSVVPKNGTEQEMWDAVVTTYAESMDKYPSNYPEGMTPEEAALENMRLVYLLREHLEPLWLPPHLRTEA